MSVLRRLWSRRELILASLAVAAAALARRIGARQPAAAPRALPTKGAGLREAVRAELGRGEAVAVRGWLLSRTEARLAAERGELPAAEMPESRP